VTLATPTDTSKTLYAEAVKLLEAYRLKEKVRLIGVGASGLTSGFKPIQLDLFNPPEHKKPSWSKIDQTVDAISQKFGKDVVKRANLTSAASEPKE
jgi:DNA polymerase-4